MTLLFAINYDGGTEGATIGTADSGWTSASSTGTRVYEAAAAVVGGFGAKCTTQTSFRKSITATNKWRLCWYQQHPSIAPGTNTTVAAARLTGTQVAGVRVEAAGTYRLVNVLTATGSSSASNTADQIDRLEWAVDGDAGTQTLYIFRGSNRHGTVPDETLTGTFTNSTADDLGVALFIAITGFVVRQDQIVATDDPNTLIGPAVVTVSAGVASATGTANDPTAGVGVAAEAATAVGTAPFDPTGGVIDLTLVSDNPVDAVGEAPDPSIALTFSADIALGTGAAYDATVLIATDTRVSAEVATAIGAAFDATVVVTMPVQLVFRGPTRTESWPIAPGARLARKVTVHQTLYRVNGIWRIGENLSYVELTGADRIYQGGFEFTLTEDQANELIGAGLSQYVVTA